MRAVHPQDKPKAAAEKQKALCVATRCSSVDQFVATFHRFCDETSFFVATLATRPVGLETAFSIQLDDKTPVLRGLCVVVEAWSTPANRFGRPGVRLQVRRLTNESVAVFKQLQAARVAAEATGVDKVIVNPPLDITEPKPVEPRTLDSKASEAAKLVDALGSVEPASTSASGSINIGAANDPEDASAFDEPTRGGADDYLAIRVAPSKEFKEETTSVDGAATDAAVASSVGAKPDLATPKEAEKPKPDLKSETLRLPMIAKPDLAKALADAKPDAVRFGTATSTAKPDLAKALADAKPTPKAGTTPEAKADASPAAAKPTAKVDATKPEIKPDAAKPDAKAPVGRLKPGEKPVWRPIDPAKPFGDHAKVSDAKPFTVPELKPPEPRPDAAAAKPLGVPPPVPKTPIPTIKPTALMTPARGVQTESVILDAGFVEEASHVGPLPRQIEPEKPVRAEGTQPTPRTEVPLRAQSPISAAMAEARNRPEKPTVRATIDAVQLDSAVASPRDIAAPEPIAATDDMTNPVSVESRTPGASFVLPANPLMNLSDQSLEGFVDCALYEETGNFARAPGYEDSLIDIDQVADPPLPRALTPIPAVMPGNVIEGMQASYVGPPPVAPSYVGPIPQSPSYVGPAPLSPYAFSAQQPQPQQFAPEATPLPMLIAPTPYPQAYGQSTQPPPYGRPPGAHPYDSTAAMLAMSANDRNRRMLIIGGVAVGASLLLLVIVLLVTGGNNKRAAAAPTEPKQTTETPPTKMTQAPTKPVETTQAPTEPTTPTKPVTPTKPATDPTDEQIVDPRGTPVVGTGPCRMSIATTPAGSIVRVDDQTIGPSPIVLDGPCRRRKVDVKHPRYALGTKWVALTEGKPANVEVGLSRPTHALTVITQPAGATISIAGRRAGTSPTSVKLMGFTGVTLTIEKKGFKTEARKVYSKVEADSITVKLVRSK